MAADDDDDDEVRLGVLDDGRERGRELARARGLSVAEMGESGLRAACSSDSRSRGLRQYPTSTLALPGFSLAVSVLERPILG